MANREELLNQAREEFAFLRQAGAHGPTTTERGTLLTRVAWTFTSIVVELSFDWRDLVIDCYISRPENGRPPEGYLLHEGRRVRFRLSDLTPSVRAKFHPLVRPTRRRPDDWVATQVETMKASLRIYAEIISTELIELRTRAEDGFQATTTAASSPPTTVRATDVR